MTDFRITRPDNDINSKRVALLKELAALDAKEKEIDRINKITQDFIRREQEKHLINKPDEQTFSTDYQAAEEERGKETVEDLKRILEEEAILEAKRVDAKTCTIEPFRNPKGEIRYLIRDVHGKIVSNAEGHGFKSTLTADRFLWVRYIQPLENK